MAQYDHTFAIPTTAPQAPPPLTSYGPRTYATQLSCFASVSYTYTTDSMSYTRASPIEYTSCATVVLSQAPVVSWQSIITLASRRRSTVWLTASNPAYLPDALLTATPTPTSIVNTWVSTPTPAQMTATSGGHSVKASLEGYPLALLLPLLVSLFATLAIFRRIP